MGESPRFLVGYGRADTTPQESVPLRGCGSNRGYVPPAPGFRNGGYGSDACWFLPGASEQFAEELIAGLKRLYD